MSNHTSTELAARSVAGGRIPREHLPLAAPPSNHGKTLAGWFLCWAVCAATLVVGIGFVMASGTVVAVGGALIAVSLIISGVLRALGHGQARPASTAAEGL